MKKIKHLSIGLAITGLFLSSLFILSPAESQPTNLSPQQKVINQQFQQFVEQLRAQAKAKGISQATIDKYLTGLKAPIPKVLHDLHNQPQNKLTFAQYAKSFVSNQKVEKGIALYKKNHEVLTKIVKQYQVSGPILIAIWGDESQYGELPGKKPLVASLVTLSFQKHRSEFYRNELFAALKMLNHQKIPEQALSYFDGGMGQPSFMPSVYNKYAVDFNHDGFANIWTDVPDVLASIANYLKINGWKANEPWAIPVNLPTNFQPKYIGKQHTLSVAQWEQLGIQINPNLISPHQFKDLQASLLVPDKDSQTGYLVFHNFKVLLRWNNDVFEALSIGILANKIYLSQNN